MVDRSKFASVALNFKVYILINNKCICNKVYIK